MIQAISSYFWVQRLGWTLIHFLWQGAAITALYAVIRALTRRSLSAQGRYALACLVLAVMLAAPPVTFLLVPAANGSATPVAWAASAAAWQRYLPGVVAAWVAGVVLFSVRLFLAWRVTARWRATAHPAPPEWQRTLREAAVRVGATRPVRLLVSSLAEVPTVIGWLRPVILAPLDSLAGAPLEQIAALLAHELAHIRRCDYLASVLQNIAEALLFYHPAVWWISQQIRSERELCCDDIAVAATGDAVTYARALADLESRRAPRLRPALAATGGSLLERIRRLAGESQPLSHGLPSPGTALALSLLCLAGVVGSAVHAAPPARTPVKGPLVTMPPSSAHLASGNLPRQAPPQLSLSSKISVALLFDPFVAAPQAPAQSSAKEEEEKKLGSLSGTVLNTAGKPVAGVAIRLVPANAAQTSVMVSTSGGMVSLPGSLQTIPAARSDAEGKYSFERIPPGSYTVRFQHKDYPTSAYGAKPGISTGGTVVTVDEGRGVKGIDVKLLSPGVFIGRMVDPDGDPIPQVAVEALVKRYYYPQSRGEIFASVTPGDDGRFRLTVPPGRYYLVADYRSKWSVDPQPVNAVKPGEKDFRWHATYWDGATQFKYSAPVEIGSGQEVQLGDFKMVKIPNVHVRGKVVGDAALLQGARVGRVPGATDSLCWTCAAEVQPDGSFDLPNMWPYDFSIGVYSSNRACLGWTDIVVGDRDLEGVQLQAAATPLSGAITVEGLAAGAQNPPMPARIELTSTGYYKLTVATPVNPDGSFTISPAPPGTYFLNVVGVPRDSYIKSARLNGRDALTRPLDWGGSNAALEIIMSRKTPVLEGSVTDADGNPITGTVTLVADPARPGHPLLYPTAKADQNGKFRLQSVIPGSYRVFAWESIPDGAHGVPEFIDAFTAAGERVELSEGDRKTVVLKRITVESMQATLGRASR